MTARRSPRGGVQCAWHDTEYARQRPCATAAQFMQRLRYTGLATEALREALASESAAALALFDLPLEPMP